MWLFLAFLAVPLIEIALFIQVGGAIGLLPTLALVFLTAVAGTWLMRREGMRALADLQRSFNELRDPTGPIAHGAMILLAGALLLTPGFFTDTIGLLLLIPQVRAAVMRHFAGRVRMQGFTVYESGGFAEPRPGTARDAHRPDVIDGEFHEIPDDTPPTRGGSGWTRG